MNYNNWEIFGIVVMAVLIVAVIIRFIIDRREYKKGRVE